MNNGILIKQEEGNQTAADWSRDCTILLDLIARKFGRLRKGGDPCLRSAAVMMILDYQRGRLPHYVAPPELKKQQRTNTNQNSKGGDGAAVAMPHVTQDLNAVGQEHMKHDPVDDDDDDEKANDGKDRDSGEGFAAKSSNLPEEE